MSPARSKTSTSEHNVSNERAGETGASKTIARLSSILKIGWLTVRAYRTVSALLTAIRRSARLPTAALRAAGIHPADPAQPLARQPDADRLVDAPVLQDPVHASQY